MAQPPEAKASPVTRDELVATWEFDGFYFEGNHYPRPNPNLQVIFEFHQDGTHSLYWARKGELGFCERRGTFELNGDLLTMRSTWLNPANDPDCSKDSDMQPGRVTVNRVAWHLCEESELGNLDLGIEMELNGKPLTYLLTRSYESRR